MLKLIATVLVLGLSGLSAVADERGRISVRGEGVVAVAPDMARLSVGVGHEAREAADAMARVGTDAAAVLERLVALGIDKTDIQTQTISLYPVWDNTQGITPPRVRGFRAQTQLTVRLRDLSQVSDVLDAVVSDGANQLGGLEFTLADPSEYQDMARERAVADATDRAILYARAAGVRLGQVLEIAEDGASAPGPVMMEAAAMRSAPGMPVAAGEIELRAGVRMVFAIGGH